MVSGDSLVSELSAMSMCSLVMRWANSRASLLIPLAFHCRMRRGLLIVCFYWPLFCVNVEMNDIMVFRIWGFSVMSFIMFIIVFRCCVMFV